MYIAFRSLFSMIHIEMWATNKGSQQCFLLSLQKQPDSSVCLTYVNVYMWGRKWRKMYVLKSSKYLNFPYCTNLQRTRIQLWKHIHIYNILCVCVCVHTCACIWGCIYVYCFAQFLKLMNIWKFLVLLSGIHLKIFMFHNKKIINRELEVGRN